MPESVSAPEATDPVWPPQPLCPSTELAERGKAHVFDLQEFGRRARGFVLRFDGQVYGYVNRCAHVPAELDWQAGEFLDDSRRWIICSIHGAVYEPTDGRCVSGPCPGRKLHALTVQEREGQVYWYPAKHLTPAPAV